MSLVGTSFFDHGVVIVSEGGVRPCHIELLLSVSIRLRSLVGTMGSLVRSARCATLKYRKVTQTKKRKKRDKALFYVLGMIKTKIYLVIWFPRKVCISQGSLK